MGSFTSVGERGSAFSMSEDLFADLALNMFLFPMILLNIHLFLLLIGVEGNKGTLFGLDLCLDQLKVVVVVGLHFENAVSIWAFSTENFISLFEGALALLDQIVA